MDSEKTKTRTLYEELLGKQKPCKKTRADMLYLGPSDPQNPGGRNNNSSVSP